MEMIKPPDIPGRFVIGNATADDVRDELRGKRGAGPGLPWSRRSKRRKRKQKRPQAEEKPRRRKEESLDFGNDSR
jgi:hypothetical protein